MIRSMSLALAVLGSLTASAQAQPGAGKKWVGGFSSAPNTKKADDLVKDPADAARKLKLLWVSCGDRDGLMRITQRFHETLEQKKVPHVWQVDSGGHDFNVWKTDLHHFAPLLFR